MRSLSLGEILAIHRSVMAQSGGMAGIRDPAALESSQGSLLCAGTKLRVNCEKSRWSYVRRVLAEWRCVLYKACFGATEAAARSYAGRGDCADIVVPGPPIANGRVCQPQ